MFSLTWFAPVPPVADSPALHIPDGFLSLPIALAAWIAAAILLYFASQRAQADLGDKQVPLMGIMAAFIFAAQMINFPIGGGTSGHLLGGVLAAIVLGPWAGMLVMASVVAVQALLFQDGGLVAMGANILNMGLLTALIGHGIYGLGLGRAKPARMALAAVAAWLSVMAGAVATALQVWLSGSASLGMVMPAMAGVHAVIGVGEALITVTALGFIAQSRPDLMGAAYVRPAAARWSVVALVVSAAVVLFAPWASAHPDGLERVAEDLGFLGFAQDPVYELLPDYTVPFLGDGPLSVVVSGLVGVAIMVGLMYVVARILRAPGGARV